jgi:hypothetical protein
VQVEGYLNNVEDVLYVDASGTESYITLSHDVFIGYVLVEDIDYDNWMTVVMMLEMPEELAADEAVIYQYI